MAQVLTDQDFQNAKIDIEDIGQSVNESMVITPRYGAPYKSIPMLSAEAQTSISGWNSAIQLITQENGVPALAVSDASGKTQQEVNNNQAVLNTGLESIEDMLAIVNPQDGMRVFIKSYHRATNFALKRPFWGGGDFVFIQDNASINNGGTITNGWTRIKDNSTVYFDDFGVKADGVADDWDAINRAINFKASTAYLGDWSSTSIRTTGDFEFGEGVHRITKPILLPPYTRIKGAGNRWYFAGDVSQSNTIIKPDFTDVYQFAFQSANYVTATGALIGVDRNYSGVVVDSKEITSTLGINLSGFSIEPASKILGGIRLVASAKSRLENIHITTIDMGVVMNSSWSSYVDVTTQHDKTGLLIGWACNNCEVRGYYTGTTNAVLPNNFWRNHLEGAASSYGLSSGSTNPELKFGIFGRYNQGTDLPNIICEGNDYSVACLDGDFIIGAIYSEKNRSATILSYQAQLTIDNTTGGLDASIFDIGHRSDVNLKQYGQLYVNQSTLIKNLSRNKTRLTVPNNFNYIIPHVYTQQEVKKLYVDSVNGNDLNVGDFYNPLKTVNAAVQRASFEMGLNDTNDQVVMMREIVIVDNSTHTLSTHATLQGVVRITTTQTTSKPKLLFNAQLVLNNCTLSIMGVDVERGSVVMPLSQDGCFIASDGVSTLNLTNNTNTILVGGLINERYLTTGILNIIARNCTFTGASTTQIYGNNTGQDTTHLVNLVLKGVTYSGGLESLSNKGWNIPTALRGNIIGVTLS